ncbi:MAG: hypothetical protein HY912_01435 [Desulfomonile tiedjei]|uniref:Fibronectin type-III domain-containing protein n=1 Tax=Desulfomonile tiedjei TaxID=2358 RepID=A0A9D6Z1W9_9BACT|nr:hypothetical protein [Desulfomonile tiedjei]
MVHRIWGIFLVLAVPLVLMACSGSVKIAAGVPPKPPADVASEVVAQGIEIYWNAVPGATSYTVFWGTEPADYRSMVNSNVTTVLLRGLQKERTYHIAVTSWNQFGESAFSDEQFLVYDDDVQNAAKYFAAGEELLKRGHYHDAKAYFSAAITCDPENGEAYSRRAFIYEKTSRWDLAKKDYSQAETIYKKKMSNTDPVKGAFLKN